MKALQFTLLVGLMLLQPLASFGQRYGDEDEAPLIPQEDFDELLMWMVDGKYEKVLYKAIRYTEDDDTKKEPVPYVFMSMAFFKISESSDEELLEKYSKALKDALKYASKFVKKDKEKEYISEYVDYFNDLRRATMNQAESTWTTKVQKGQIVLQVHVDLGQETRCMAHVWLCSVESQGGPRCARIMEHCRAVLLE